MASLYKKPVILTDPATGEKVKAKSKKWWGRYTDAIGREKRVPLATDKRAAQVMLNEIVNRIEREQAGLADPFEEHARRPLSEHIDAYEAHLQYKGNSEQYICEVPRKIRRIARQCRWSRIADISAGDLQRFLADLRQKGLSVQTSNHYLRAAKQLSRWLVRDRRAHDDPLLHLSKMNVQVDRRHDRRALSPEEFGRLVEAAEQGRRILRIPGADRAMMYILSAWTGYRKSEIGSLTKRSFQLEGSPATVTVQAGYSKRRREDTQVLHPELADRLRRWLETKKRLGPDTLLFPVSERVPGGIERRTSLMMRKDLASARKRWIEEAGDEAEKGRREESDFLAYCDSAGRYADFHSNRHTFITNLERAGVSPRTAQTLARHSDIRLTMGIYTHIELDAQTSAIQSLPAPPNKSRDENPSGSKRPRTGAA